VGPCSSLHYPQESAPLEHIVCLVGHKWSLTCLAKILGEHCKNVHVKLKREGEKRETVKEHCKIFGGGIVG